MKSWFKIFLILVAVSLLSACSSATPSPTPVDQSEQIHTAAAMTIEAMSTSIVATDWAASTATMLAQPQATPTPTIPIEPVLSPTPEPSQPPAATMTLTPPPSGDPNCNLAAFVDETIPDGSLFFPGTVFTKTWTLRNEGSCTWTTDYEVVFVSGNSMGAPASQAIAGRAIAPGETVVISMPLTAPNGAGAYKAEFRLRTAEGVIFAFRNAETTFWAQIQVSGEAINLADSYCSATWTSPTGKLHCPGQPGDSGGFVYSDNRPILENGAQDDETALWMGLYNANDSWLEGRFPAMSIPPNAHFTAILGCRRGNNNCDVKFSLNYEDNIGGLVEIKSWNEVYDQKFQQLDVDLRALAGKQVKIVLRLNANGSPAEDMIHLLQPIIKP